MACIVPYSDFVATADAEAMHKFTEALHKNKQGIIDILTHRTINQRKQIVQAYKSLYGRNLLHHLSHELEGKFRDVVEWSFYSRSQLNAAALKFAIDHFDTDDAMLVDVLCTVTNHEMHHITRAYEEMFGEDLQGDIINVVGGHLQKIFLMLMEGNREATCDPAQAQADADALFRAGQGRIGTDDCVFTQILCKRSYEQIKIICDLYLGVAGNSLIDGIKKEVHGDYQSALIRIVEISQDRVGTIAKMLYDSMSGVATRDHSVMRLVLEHAEINLGQVREAFAAAYGQPLAQMIAGDTSGSYKDFLVAIVQQNP